MQAGVWFIQKWAQRIGVAVAALAGVAACVGGMGIARAELPSEELQQASYPPLTAHRIHLVSWMGGIMDRTYVIDGDSGKMLGMIPNAYNSVIKLGPEGDYYSSDTYYDKIWRGTRTDQITVFDHATGLVSREIPLAPTRFQAYTLNPSFDFTEGGRYLLQYNMTPAGSVTVLEPKTGAVIAEIPSAGCSLVFPSGPTSFAMLCADGGLLRVDFSPKINADGQIDANAEVKTEQVPPFFDAENDPLMQNGLAFPERHLGLFISYEGKVHELDLAGPALYQSPVWSLRSAKQAMWWPSGWQPLAYSPALDRIYVLMRKTKKWDHTAGGKDVWVLDRKTHQRIASFKLKEEAISIAVSADAKPQLYAVDNKKSVLYVLDAVTGKTLHTVTDMGNSPISLMTVPSYLLPPAIAPAPTTAATPATAAKP